MCAWPFEICVGLSINTLFSLSTRVKNTFFPFLSKGKITLFLKKIAGMGDLIGHGYDSFDHESIWPILMNSFLNRNRSVRVFCPNRMWSNVQFPVVVICIAIRSINCFLQINLQKTACFLQKNLQKTGYIIWNDSIWHIE
jgi:hypothetical protein